MSDLTQGVCNKKIVLWLIVVYLMILIMVSLGGITRITGSGLSMVDWRPVFGFLPPLSELEWVRVFENYKGTPQFIEVNSSMTLLEFKEIFLWEYFHRVWGRLIGLAVLLPWVYFKLTKQLTPYVSKRTLFGLFWGGLQGGIGWYMVKSGLVDIPEVSHYRLTLHLFMAFFIAIFFVWILLNYCNVRQYKKNKNKTVKKWSFHCFSILIVFQIIYGAFMGGKKAGYLVDTFPSMRGEWLPSAFMSDNSLVYQLLENPFLIHYIHRFLALLILVCSIFVIIELFKQGDKMLKFGAWALLLLVGLQITTGALTVIYHVPVVTAVLHQACAVLLITTHTYNIYIIKSDS